MIASFAQPACAALRVEKTFILQFCCSVDDCNRAGLGSFAGLPSLSAL